MKTFSLSLTLLFFSILSVAQEFTVHEWGTFTSLYSSEGVQLNGLEKEEESLPNFVYNLMEPTELEDCVADGSVDIFDFGHRYAISNLCETDHKGIFTELANVNVKMETPVIYFYSDNAIENIKVAVDFNGGSISQWYPQKEAGESIQSITSFLGETVINFSLPYVGNIEWNIDILHPQDRPDLLVDGSYSFINENLIWHEVNNTWLAPRATEANIIKNKEAN